MPELPEKYHHLQRLLRRWPRVLIAYSGGADSTLLLKVALEVLGPANVLACIGTGPLLQQSEYHHARDLARRLGAALRTVPRTEMADPVFRANTPDRCYHCKAALFAQLVDLARRHGCAAVLCGGHADDRRDYRPGNRALAEFSVACPLEDAGFTKADIRALSRQLDLPTWDKPAEPCLATRLAYRLEITPARLRQVEHAEAFLRDLGFPPPLRVRHHGDLARIELPLASLARAASPDTRRLITDRFRQLGFTYVALDLAGFRSGSANETL